MPELRQNPFTKQWVIIATERAKRPHELARKLEESKPLPSYVETCPFCPGNERLTPPESMQMMRDGKWQVRVVPNKFPALQIEESSEKYAFGIYDKIGGFGAHEVIIENPDHEKEMCDLSEENVELIIRAYRDRCLDLRKDKRFKYILIFKN